MNTRLQSELLTVLYGLIPESCQLMLATHSIGMMRRARDIEANHPGTVVFLNFGDLDFDLPQIIEPTKPDRQFWKKAHQVALDDLAALVARNGWLSARGIRRQRGRYVTTPTMHDVTSVSSRRSTQGPVSFRWATTGGFRRQVRTGPSVAVLVDGLDVVRLIDRDDRSDQEIADAQGDGVRVLSRRNLESYLFDDDMLRTLASSVNQEDKADELIAEKKRIVDAESDSSPSDNLKHASGQIYNVCKNTLNLTQRGKQRRSFYAPTRWRRS